jgi:F-type H+-transporting ATPase subunit delta
MNRISRTRLAKNFVKLLPHHPKSALVQALANVVISQHLTNQLDLLINDINSELLKSRGQLAVDIISAHRLSETAETQLKHLIKQKTGAHTLTVHHTLEPQLLGGVIVNTPDMQIDLSVKGKLDRLGASRG